MPYPSKILSLYLLKFSTQWVVPVQVYKGPWSSFCWCFCCFSNIALEPASQRALGPSPPPPSSFSCLKKLFIACSSKLHSIIVHAHISTNCFVHLTVQQDIWLAKRLSLLGALVLLKHQGRDLHSYMSKSQSGFLLICLSSLFNIARGQEQIS